MLPSYELAPLASTRKDAQIARSAAARNAPPACDTAVVAVGGQPRPPSGGVAAQPARTASNAPSWAGPDARNAPARASSRTDDR